MGGAKNSDGTDTVEEYFKKGPACTRCGDTGHSPKHCRRQILREHAGKRCEHCIDMSYRRDRPKCLGCGKPWEPESVEHQIPTPGSGCHGF